MEINGLDLAGLAHEAPTLDFPTMVPGRIVHIDADFLAYQCSAQGEGDQKTFEDMKHNADVAIETFKQLSAAEFVHLHLTPFSSNKGGRREQALQKEYQANRKDRERPKYLHVMREYMAQRYHGKMHEDCEADDGMSSSQYAALARGEGHLSIICSKDKDLDMVPGLHLHWDRGAIIETDGNFGTIWIDNTKSTKKLKGLGQKFFWAQMLMGDTADNIQGIPKVLVKGKPKACGPVLTFELLEDCKTNAEAFKVVRTLYQTYGHAIGFKDYRTGAPVAWSDVFLSEARLLWMRRNKGNADCVVEWLKEIVNGTA